MIKRPNTIKMHRLLQQLAECDPRSIKELRELQDDARKLLGLVDSATAKQQSKATQK